MNNVAQNLAAQGRYGDSMLVHMSPQEVGGLQTLARSQGGSLTTNPDTGLPEAFKLRDLLPTLAGAALTIGSGGAINPMTAGFLVGGFESLRTGNLGRGIMAGLGAFGGGGLGSALASAGAAAPGAVASNLGVPGAATGAGSQAAQLAAQNAGFGQAGLESLRSAASTATGANMAAPLTTSQLALEGSRNLGSLQGISNLGTGLNQTFPTMTQKALAATPATLGIMEATQPKYDLAAAPTEKSNYAGPYVPSPRSVRFPGQRDSTSEFEYFSPSNPVPGYTTFAARGGLMDTGEDSREEFAAGGLTAFKRGAFLEGRGDGMSDSIPAVIGERQPARLADGEFVVPADVVSHLGNGSSKAGAQRLHQMMDRVRQERTGKKRQAPEIRSERFMPA